jgi:Na+-transporting NADH:ubiquinone oxidoreductase subunit B
MLSTILSLAIFTWAFYPTHNPLYFLVSGGAMFGIVFMVTDPVSSPKGTWGIWIYGLLIGFLTVFIRRYSLFAEGFMFALLLTNAFIPLIEYGLEKVGKK